MQKINGNSLFLPPQRHTFAHKKEKLPHHSGTAVFLFLSYSVFPDDLLRISRWNHRRYHRKMRYGCWNHRYYPHFSVLQILIPYCRGKNHYFWSHSYCPAAHKKPPDPVFAQFSAFFSYFRSPVILPQAPQQERSAGLSQPQKAHPEGFPHRMALPHLPA